MQPKTILKLALTAAVIISLLWGWHKLKQADTFPVKHVVIQATYTHIDRKFLANVIAPYVAQGLFNVNIDALEKELLEIPWIGKVSIKRLWPDKLVVIVIEQQPVAKWGKNALMNNEGEIFTPPAETMPNDLTLTFHGPEGQGPTMWQYYLQMKALLDPLQVSIVRADLTPRQSWHLTLSNGIEVLLGRTDVMQRLQKFVKFYPQLIASRSENVAIVDMRYANGVAVAPRKPAK